jgi:8-oxo-dGTP diphosphatase
MPSYEHPRPAVATDIAVFTVRTGRLAVLLVRRGEPPFKGQWALPGGFLRADEDLETCARRELKEETGVEAALLQHVGNFSAPDRDPRWVIAVAYFALLPDEELRPQAGTDAAEYRWFDVEEIPQLAFDHRYILDAALASLRGKVRNFELLFALLPARFTLRELQAAYDAISGRVSDKRNFRAIARDHVRSTHEFARGAHRPAELYEPSPQRPAFEPGA